MDTERKIQIETIDENPSKKEIKDVIENPDKSNPAFDIIIKGNKMSMKRKITDNDLSLFSDPRWSSAKENMSKDDLNHYEQIGKQFHESINYTTGENTGVPIPQPISESISYIEMGLRSGLSPEDLDENEIKIMEEYLGTDWLKNYT